MTRLSPSVTECLGEQSPVKVTVGLPDALWFSEIAPIVFVCVEFDDLLPGTCELQISRDDGEDALVGHLRQHLGRDDVNACESPRLRLRNRPNHLEFSVSASATATELTIVIEQEIARSLSILHGKCGKCTSPDMALKHTFEIQVADDVY